MRQSASNAGLLPLCGVAVSSTTYDVRPQMARMASSLIAAGPGAVGFIHDDEVPSAGDQGRLHLGTLDVVERRDRDGAPSSMD